MNEKTLLFIFSGIFLLLLVLVLMLKRRRKLPDGEWIYDDLTRDGKPAGPLYSARYGLSGKPDMILKTGKDPIPVEVKSASGGARPYLPHVMQLAAYCLLIEENFGSSPPYGIIRYRGKQFEVPYTAELRERLLDLTEAMRREDPETVLPSPCGDPRKCRHCGFSSVCRGE